MWKWLRIMRSKGNYDFDETSESAFHLSDLAYGAIQSQLDFVGTEVKSILDDDKNLFVLGYICGYVDVIHQATTDKYNQSIAETASAQIMQKLLGNEVGFEAFQEALEYMLDRNSQFLSGLTAGGKDANETIIGLAPLSLSEFLADSVGKVMAIELIRSTERRNVTGEEVGFEIDDELTRQFQNKMKKE